MCSRKFFTRFMGALSLFFSVLVLGICIFGQGATPRLRRQPVGAKERAEEWMDALCRGDFESAGAFVYGAPKLILDTKAASRTERVAWNAFLKSLSYEIPGECYGSETGIRVDVQLRSLDMDAVLKNLQGQSEMLLQERVNAAVNTEQIYDEENQYRQEFVERVLTDALRRTLKNAPQREQTVSLNLVFEDGQWWIMPGMELVLALSGG